VTPIAPGDAVRSRCCREDLAERRRERLDGERLTSHGCRLEESQPDDGTIDARRIGSDDPLAVNGNGYRCPRATACRISEDFGDHDPQATDVLHPADEPRPLRTWLSQVGAVRSVGFT
jgi:hypothetical protein